MSRGTLLETIELSILGNDEPVFRAPNAQKPVDNIQDIQTDQHLDGRMNNQRRRRKNYTESDAE